MERGDKERWERKREWKGHQYKECKNKYYEITDRERHIHMGMVATTTVVNGAVFGETGYREMGEEERMEGVLILLSKSRRVDWKIIRVWESR